MVVCTLLMRAYYYSTGNGTEQDLLMGFSTAIDPAEMLKRW